MKDKKKFIISNGGVSSTSSSSTTNINKAFNVLLLRRGTKAVMIRKNYGAPHDLLLLRRRLKEYILYSKLRSLIPPQPYQLGVRHEDESEELATEVEMELHEIPAAETSRDSDIHDEELLLKTSVSSPVDVRINDNLMIEREDEDEEEEEHTIVEFESSHEDDDEGEIIMGSSKPVVPYVASIKIKKMDNTIVLINAIVLKDVALTSALFKILEEEKLDIVFENQYRTETKVTHTIQVKVEPEYNIDALEKRLHKWGAGLSSSYV